MDKKVFVNFTFYYIDQIEYFTDHKFLWEKGVASINAFQLNEINFTSIHMIKQFAFKFTGL